ncbi:MAG: exonuclease [Firmicutes bacterium]|nr:exonuclease [Bacillota bacterium]
MSLEQSIFSSLGKRWRDAVEQDRVTVVEDPARAQGGFNVSFISGAEYEQARKLKRTLIRRYQGRTLEEVIPGEEQRSRRGACYCVANHHPADIARPSRSEARDRILSDLKLLYGVGPHRESALKRQGYRTIEDLTRHPHHRDSAEELLRLLDDFDTGGLIDVIARKGRRSSPSILHVSGFHDLEDFVFLDIETLGLAGVPIILFGVAWIEGGRIQVHQYLLRDIREESAALEGFFTHVRENSVFITYNGRIFDVPYIKSRAAYYGIRADLDRPHYDLLHFSRRAWRDRLPNCRLSTVESYLTGAEREDDVPGALVPDFYQTYLRTGNPGTLVPIVYHNRQDLVALAAIYTRLWEEWG